MISGRQRIGRWAAAVLAAAALAAGHSGPARAEDRSQQALRGIAMLDQRIATLAHRLAVAGVAFCHDPAPLAGFTVHHISQYSSGFQDAARQVFGLGHAPRVLAVASGGPAERAGLRRGDLLLRIDGEAVPQGGGAEGGSVRISEQVLDLVDARLADGSLELLVERAGETRIIRIAGERGCASRVNLKPAAELNAHADGSHVIVTTAVAGVVRDDAELAAVLAHELAHNMLKHRRHLDGAGWAGAEIRRTEIEADRLSIHLLHRAGFDPQAAIRFWQHFGPKRQRLFSGSHHPGWQRRIRIMADEIAGLGRTDRSSEGQERAPLPRSD